MVPSTEMAVDRIFRAGKVTSLRWLSMCPCGLIFVGTSTVPINQYQVELTASADYDVNGGRWGGGVNCGVVSVFSCQGFMRAKYFCSRHIFL